MHPISLRNPPDDLVRKAEAGNGAQAIFQRRIKELEDSLRQEQQRANEVMQSNSKVKVCPRCVHAWIRAHRSEGACLSTLQSQMDEAQKARTTLSNELTNVKSK